MQILLALPTLLSKILSPSQPVRWNWGLQSFKRWWIIFASVIIWSALLCLFTLMDKLLTQSWYSSQDISMQQWYKHPGIGNHMYVSVCNYSGLQYEYLPKKAYQTNKLLAIIYLWFTVGIVPLYYLAELNFKPTTMHLMIQHCPCGSISTLSVQDYMKSVLVWGIYECKLKEMR